MASLEKKTDIEDAIRDAGGNISKAARRLGVARRTLQNRMRFYSIPHGTWGRRKKQIHYRRISKVIGAMRESKVVAGTMAAAVLVGGAVLIGTRGKPA
jgi:transposase-like protein